MSGVNKQSFSANKQAVLIGIIAVVVIAFIIGLFSFKKTTAPPTTQPSPATSRKDLLIRADSYQKGNANAPLSIVEFIDFQCEACAYVYPIVQKTLDEYGQKARLIVRYWPLEQHKNAKAAIYAAEAAGELDKYWEMYALLMTNQKQWSEANSFWDVFAVKFAKDLGLENFPGDLKTAADKFAAKVERDSQDAIALKTTGVPHFFINGVYYGYLKSSEELKEKLDKELALCGRETMTEDDILNGRLLCSSI